MTTAAKTRNRSTPRAGTRRDAAGGTYLARTARTGNSRALRIDARFWSEHPEFKKDSDVRVKSVAPGVVVIATLSVHKRGSRKVVLAAPALDPTEQAFLALIEREMEHHPTRVEALDAALLAEAERLTEGVEP